MQNAKYESAFILHFEFCNSHFALCPAEPCTKSTPLLPDAELAEDTVQNIVGVDGPDDVAQVFQHLAQLNDDQVIETHGNKPGEWRYLRFTLTSAQDLTLQIVANPVPPDLSPAADERDRSDPDVFLYKSGALRGFGRSGAADQEIFDMGLLEAGTYTLAFQDWRYEDGATESDPPAKHPGYPSRVCFDFTLN